MRRFFQCLLAFLLVFPWTGTPTDDAPARGTRGKGDGDQPGHGRPYFMPEGERSRLRALIRDEPWAAALYTRIRDEARKGDGFHAAFLYALDRDPAYLPTARTYLLGQFGPDSFASQKAAAALRDPNHFKGGPKDEEILYYDLNHQPLLAFDWVHDGLAPADRKALRDGMLTWARYKMRAMDTWVQTPNLVFKPTWIVCLIGLATGDRACLEWGFRRKGRWGPERGGYFAVLDSMLVDGAWHEAPIYPVAHDTLWCMSFLARCRQLYDGRDWFSSQAPHGGSPKRLMDYYLDTAYPVEKTGFGAGQVRVATYGDGATNAKGDLFLVNPAGNEGGDWVLEKALASSYLASADPRYAAFLKVTPHYPSSLFYHRPLPAKSVFPPAPSKVWPEYGLAMLRSDESPGYWTNPKAIAAFQVMTRGYGHDHRDKFHLCLFGANRLLYPDYNAVQYENLAVGWTRNSPAHNTLLVDERDTADAPMTAVRHAFAPEVKFLATCADKVFPGVAQTRALLLTPDYLLDVFHAASAVPHTYDYLLHGFGTAHPDRPERFTPSAELTKRYWLVEQQRTARRDDGWALDFERREVPGFHKGKYGKEWYDHVARVRVTMAAEPGTVVGHGVWGKEVARLVAEKQPGAKLDKLASLIVRRAGARDTAFVAAHEPYANQEKPRVRAVRVLARTEAAVLVRVEADGFTDYAAVAFGPQQDGREHSLGKAGEVIVAFRDYAYFRVRGQKITARGGLTGLALPGAKGQLVLNGKPATLPAPARAPDKEVERPPEFPGTVRVAPSVLRVFDRDRRESVVSLANPLKQALSGRLVFDLPPGVRVEPAEPTFAALAPGGTAKVPVRFLIDRPAPGPLTVPYRIRYARAGAKGEIVTGALPVALAVGPTLELQYRHPQPAAYVLRTPGLTAKLRAADGLCDYLADDDDTPRLDGSPLFTLADAKGTLLSDRAVTLNGETWPRYVPGELVASAGRADAPLCRWQLLPVGKGLLVRLDRIYSQFDRAYFTVPGKWVSPGGPPRWKRVVEAGGKVSAAELEFPGAKYNLAFRFEPPQAVEFRGAGLRFSVNALGGDNWQVGFIRPGEFDAWSGKR